MSHESRLIADSSEWTFPMIERYNEVIGQIAVNDFGLDVYPNQIEIITAEQMMDAYSSVGMPLGYKHWSYGKQFVLTEKNYRRGQMGLAYEIVINSDPCIAYLMEENTAMMQALVIAHAAYGHNSFFKGNYLFRAWTSADAIIDYLLFARNYVAECEERYGEETVELFLDSCHALMNYGVDRYKHPAPLSLQRGEATPERAGRISAIADQRPVAHHADQAGRSRRRGNPALPGRAAGKPAVFHRESTRRCWNPGSANWCGSSARLPSISTRSARPR